MKYLMIPVLATLALTGCGKRNVEPEPKDEVINTNTEEGKEQVTSFFDEIVELYSNPTNIKALHVSEELKDMNLVLNASIKETTNYGLNELGLSFRNFSVKADQFARIDEERKVEGMVNVRELQGRHSVNAGLLQPLTGQVEGEEPVGVFVQGHVIVAPSNFDAYFKDGKGYFDLTDEGIRTTLENANQLATDGYQAYQLLEQKLDEIDAANQHVRLPLREGEQQQPEQQPQPQGLDLNAMLDQYVGASRKFQTVLEENGFVIDEEDYQAAKEEEVAKSKADAKEFVDNILPTLAASEIVTVTALGNGGLQLEVSLNKQKVVNAIPFIEAYMDAKEAEEQAQSAQQQPEQQPLSIRRDGEQQQPEQQPVEPTTAEIFDQVVSKFDVYAKVVFDQQGYLRDVAVNYDIVAGVAEYPWKFFNAQGLADVDLVLSGKIAASIQYNDEVSFALPEDLEQYALVDFKD